VSGNNLPLGIRLIACPERPTRCKNVAIDRVAPAATLNALPALVSGTIGLGAVASPAILVTFYIKL